MNMHLATCHALMEKHPGTQIHMAPLAAFQIGPREPHQMALVRRPLPRRLRFTRFLASMLKRMGCDGRCAVECLMHRPGAAGIGLPAQQLELSLWAWTGEEHEDIYVHDKGLIQAVNPGVVVVDS